jgi:hypothetical protein
VRHDEVVDDDTAGNLLEASRHVGVWIEADAAAVGADLDTLRRLVKA